MKKNFIYLILVFSVCLSVYAQNSKPEVTNVHSVIDTVQKSITVYYDVEDADGDQLEVTFGVSNDYGITFLVDVSEGDGDAGFPVLPGTGKSITCIYDPDNANFLPGFPNFKIRICADDKQEINIQNIVDEVNTTILWNDLLKVEGVRNRTDGLQHLLEVRDTLTNRILSNSLQHSIQEFTIGSFVCQNIIGRLPGLADEEATIIIDGHYDSVPGSPGADDNGTAVAGVLQAVNVLSKYNFNKTIKFIFFDAEEDGLVGSKKYVLTGVPAYCNIEGVLNFEMAGYYSDEPNSQTIPAGFDLLFPAAVNEIQAQENKGNFIINAANVNSNSLRFEFDSCAARYVPELRVISLAVAGVGAQAPILRRSDHASFWDASLKALMLTDGAETRNLNYHTPNDVASTLNQAFFTNVVKAVIATAAKLAGPVHAGFAVSDEFEILTTVNDNSQLPGEFVLSQNYPNPFNPSTGISYYLPSESILNISVFNSIGEKVDELYNGIQTAGKHSIIWNASGFASGVYIITAEALSSQGGMKAKSSIKLSLLK